MTAIHVLLRYLELEGVEYIFGIPGGAITPLYEALFERKTIQPILAKHEEGAAFMAHGYARASRKIGVCCTTTGPGGTNALTGIAAAHADSVPILLITAQVSTRVFGTGALQESTSFGVDLVEIFRPITKMSIMIPSAERVPAMVQRALRVAQSGRPGPVHLSLPADVQKQLIRHEVVQRACYRTDCSSLDLEATQKAARALVTAERPCILAGSGVALAGAEEELSKLATRFQIPVATTPKGKGVFPESHPLSLGVFGFAGHPWADNYLLGGLADVLIVVGSSLGEWATHAGDPRLQPTKTLIHVDIDPAEIGKNYPTAIGVVGDAKAVLGELVQQLGKLRAGRSPFSDEPLKRVRATMPRYRSLEAQSSAACARIKPQHMVREMQRVLPSNTLLFVDIGNCISWLGHYYEIRETGTYFVNLGLASMGHAPGASIGGKLASPDKPVVAVLGDGAFAMNGMEIHTAVDHRIPIVWVVLNNCGHGMVYQGDKLLLGRHLNSTLFNVPIDVCGVAQGLGAKTFKCDTLASFRPALEQALTANCPCVIEALIDDEEIPSSLRQRVRTLDNSFHNEVNGSPVAIHGDASTQETREQPREGPEGSTHSKEVMVHTSHRIM
jgi:acetolactate synthase-1/2/3 large subunit